MISKFCSHDYILVEFEITPNSFVKFYFNNHITDYKCSKCGKLKRLKVKV